MWDTATHCNWDEKPQIHEAPQHDLVAFSNPIMSLKMEFVSNKR